MAIKMRPTNPSQGLCSTLLALGSLLACSVAFASAKSSTSGPAQSELLLDGTPHQVLFDIHQNKQSLFAVGVGGRILRSDDAGKNWVAEQTPSQMALLGIASAGEHTIAVGQMGLILQRQADQTWQVVESGTQERLFDVAINSSGVGIAVGAFGTLLRTQNGGSSWVKAAPDFKGVFRDGRGLLGDFFAPNMYGVQINEQSQAWVVGELALIMLSSTGGQDWQIVHAGGNDAQGIDPTLSGVDVHRSGMGFAVGQEGYLLRTQDGGQEWVALERPSDANLLGVVVAGNDTVVLTGMRDMRISNDGGDSFIPVRGNGISTGWFHGITTTPKGDYALTVGVSGKILLIGK